MSQPTGTLRIRTLGLLQILDGDDDHAPGLFSHPVSCFLWLCLLSHAVVHELVFDSKDALYVGDEDNNSVRRIDQNRTISSLDSSKLPAPPWRPRYLAVDSARDLYVSERGGLGFGGGCRIVRVSQARVLETGTRGFKGDGGPAIAAEFNDNNGLAFDSAGNRYVSDSGNQRIRRIDRKGVITTVAGTGIAGFSGDGGLGTQAQLSNPFGIGIGSGDKLHIAEGGGHRVRLLQLSNDTITTVTRQTASLVQFKNWRGRDGNDPSVDIAKDADQRF